MVRTKEKRKVKVVYETSILKRKRRSYLYRPHYFPDIMYEEWLMENAFSNYVQDKIRRNSKEYKLHKTVCDSIIIAEDFNIKAIKNKKNPIRNKNYKVENRK